MFRTRKCYIDLHVHTNRHSPCSTLTPEQAIAEARARGLDGLVFTEHDYCWPEAELAEMRRLCPGFALLSGWEVRSRHEDRFTGDLLVFGAPLPPEEGTIGAICRQTHRAGGIVVAPHPLVGFQGICDELRTSGIDAIEVYNHRYRREQGGRVREAWRTIDLPGVASSDAHGPGEVGRYCTEFDGPVRTIGELVEAVREGRCRPHAAPPPALHRWLRGVRKAAPRDESPRETVGPRETG